MTKTIFALGRVETMLISLLNAAAAGVIALGLGFSPAYA